MHGYPTGFRARQFTPGSKVLCVTQGALQKLTEIVGQPGHSFWAEPTDGYANKVFLQTLPNTLTHAQVTDSYLATVAMFNQGTLATLDRDLGRTFDKYSVLVAP